MLKLLLILSNDVPFFSFRPANPGHLLGIVSRLQNPITHVIQIVHMLSRVLIVRKIAYLMWVRHINWESYQDSHFTINGIYQLPNLPCTAVSPWRPILYYKRGACDSGTG